MNHSWNHDRLLPHLLFLLLPPLFRPTRLPNHLLWAKLSWDSTAPPTAPPAPGQCIMKLNVNSSSHSPFPTSLSTFPVWRLYPPGPSPQHSLPGPSTLPARPDCWTSGYGQDRLGTVWYRTNPPSWRTGWKSCIKKDRDYGHAVTKD